MLGNQLLNSVPGFEEDLNRLKGWTSYTLLVKPDVTCSAVRCGAT